MRNYNTRDSIQQHDEDELAFGNKGVRGNFVRISWSALFGIDMIAVLGSLIGSLVVPLRDIAKEEHWTFVGIGIGFVAAAFVPMLVVTCRYSVRHNTPINFVILVIQACFMCGAFLCFSATCNSKWLVPSFLVAIQSYLLFVILFTFCLDVGKCVPYILSTLLSAGGLICLFIIMYDPKHLELWVVVLLPLIVVIYNLMNSTSAVTVMRKTDELEIDEDDYLLGAVYFRIGGDSYINCCRRASY